MKSEGRLSSASSQQFTLRQKETIPSPDPFAKPKLDRSLERKSKEVYRQCSSDKGLGIVGSRANSPGRPTVIPASHSKQFARVTESRTHTPFNQKTPHRQHQSATPIQTGFVPAFSETRAASPSRLYGVSENELSRRTIQQIIINPPPIMHTQLLQFPQPLLSTHNVTLPQVVTTQSVHVPAGTAGPMPPPSGQFNPSQAPMQQSMVVNNSHNTELLNQKDEVLRHFKQSIDQKEGQLRNYEVHINVLEDKLEEQELEKRANIILTSFVTEISGYFSQEELTLEQLKQNILHLIQENHRLKQLLDAGAPGDRQKRLELTEELERLMVRYKELETKLSKTQLSLFELTRDNSTKTREIEQLRTKVLQLQSQSSSSSSIQSNPRIDHQTEMRNLKSLNFSLEKELEVLRGKMGLSNIPHVSILSQKAGSSFLKGTEIDTGSQAITNVSYPMDVEHLRAKLLAAEVQLQTRNQQLMILSQRIRVLEEERHGIPSKSNDSLSYSLETYDRENRLADMNHSNIRKVRQDDNSSSALRLINSLGQIRAQETYESMFAGGEERQLQQQPYLQQGVQVSISEVSKVGDTSKKSLFGLQQPFGAQLDVVPELSSRSNLLSAESSVHNSELEKQSAVVQLTTQNQQLRQRIVELQNENAYTKERLRAQLTTGDKEEMVRKNQQLKDEKIKLELKIIGLEKENAEIQSKVREMWDMHKRQVETEREKIRLQVQNSKQKELILKARIHELEDVVQIEKDRKGRQEGVAAELNRYEQMEEELRTMHEFRLRAAELQTQLNALKEQNEQLRKDQASKDSDIAVFRQQLEGLALTKRLLEEQLGISNQAKSRSTSLNPLLEAVTIIPSKVNSGYVEIGVNADFPSEDEQLLAEYREQLEVLNERVDLLTINNSRLKTSEQALKIDAEALKRHLEQTSGQMDVLIKELDEARQKNERVSQMELELEEYRNRVQTYKLHERSFRSEEGSEALIRLESSPDKPRQQSDLHTIRNLEQDVHVLSEQLKLCQRQITASKEQEESLKSQYEKDVRRLENDLRVYKQSAQGSMSLCDENDLLKRELEEMKHQRKDADLSQFTHIQDQQREVIGQLTVKLEESSLATKRLEQQNELLTEKLKCAQEENVVLKEAEVVFKKAQAKIINQNSSMVRTYEEQIRSINRELDTMRQEIVQLKQAEVQYQQNTSQLEQIGRQNVQKLARSLEEQHEKYRLKEQELTSLRAAMEVSERNRQELAAHVQKLSTDTSKFKSTEDALRKKLEELNKMYSDINEEKIKDAERYIRDINQERSNRIEAVRQVQESLYQQEAEKTMKLQQDISNQLAELRKEGQILKSELVLTQTVRDELKTKLAAAQKENVEMLDSMQNAEQKAASTVKTLEAQIMSIKQQAQEVGLEKQKYIQRLQHEFNTEKTRLERQFQEQESGIVGKMSELELLCEELKAANQRLTEENAFCNERFIEGKTAIERLEGMFREIEHAHLLKIGELESYIDELRKAQASDEQRIQQLTHELVEKTREVNLIATSEKEHLNRISEMESAIERIQQSSHQKQQHLHACIESGAQECQNLKLENSLLGQKLRVAESAMLRETEAHAANEEMSSILAKLKQQNEQLHARQHDQFEQISYLEKNEHQLNVANSQLQQQIKEMTGNIEYLNSAVRELNGEIEKYKAQLSGAQTQINDRNAQRHQLQYLSERLQGLQQANESLEQEAQSVRGSNQRLTMQLAEVTQQCDYLSAEKDKLERIVSQLASELQVSAGSLKKEDEPKLKLDFEIITKELQSVQQERNRLRQELALHQRSTDGAIRSSTSIIHPTDSTLRRQISELNQQCQRLYGEKIVLEQKVDQLTHQPMLQADSFDARTLVSRLGQSPTAVHQDLSALAELCEQLVNQKARLEQEILQLNDRVQFGTIEVKSTVSVGLGTSIQSLPAKTGSSEIHSKMSVSKEEHDRLLQNVTLLTTRLREHTSKLIEVANVVSVEAQTHQQPQPRRLTVQLEEVAHHNTQLAKDRREQDKRIEQLNHMLRQTTDSYHASEEANANLKRQLIELSERCEAFEVQLEGMFNQLFAAADSSQQRILHSFRSFGVGPSSSNIPTHPSTQSIGVSNRSIAQASETLSKLANHCELLVAEKGRLERTVNELTQVVDRKQPVEDAAVRLLTIQIEELNNQCQFLANEHLRAEKRNQSLSDELAQTKSARRNEADRCRKLQLQLEQAVLEREQAIKDKVELEFQLTRQAQALIASSTESVGQALSSTTLIRNIVAENANQMNGRLERQLINLSEQCDQLALAKHQLEARVSELTSMLERQQLLARSVTSVPSNTDIRSNAQIYELNRQCESLSFEKGELERRVSELAEQLRKVAHQARGGVHTNIEVETNLKLARQEGARLTGQVEALRAQLTQAEEAVRTRDRELGDLVQKFETLNREYLSTKQLMDGLRARSVEALDDPMQRDLSLERSLSNEAERMLLSEQPRSSSTLGQLKEGYEKELQRLMQSNNDLANQNNALANERENLRRQVELRYQECNSLKLNLQHLQLINSELADELKEYIKPAAAIQQQQPQHHRYSLPESIKESKSEHSVVQELGQSNVPNEAHLKDELQRQQTSGSKLRAEVEALRELNMRLERQLMQLQKRGNESTDYSLQESIKLLKNDLSDRQRQLESVRQEYSQFRATNDFERGVLQEQIKAMKQVSYDLERYNTELTERNTQLESRLRITQTDSVNLHVRQEMPSNDKTSRSEHFKQELDSIIQEMHSKRPESVHASQRRPSRSTDPVPVLREDTPEPRKPRILKSKTPELSGEYFTNSGKFENPFDEDKDVDRPTVQPTIIVNQKAANQNTFSFMRFTEPTKPFVEQDQPSHPKPNTASQMHINYNSSSSSINNQLVPLHSPTQSSVNTVSQSLYGTQHQKRVTTIRLDESLNSRQKHQLPPTSPDQLAPRSSLPKSPEEVQPKRNSNSQDNVNYIRVTELSRNRVDQSAGSQQVIMASSPRSSQGPAQFVKKSVILNKNTQLTVANEPVGGVSRPSISNQTVRSSRGLPNLEGPYFGTTPSAESIKMPSSGQTTPRVKTIKMESLRSSRTPASHNSEQTLNQQPVSLQKTPSQQLLNSNQLQQASSQSRVVELRGSQQQQTNVISQQSIQLSIRNQQNLFGAMASKLQEIRTASLVPPNHSQPIRECSEMDYSVSSSSRRSSSQSSLPGITVLQQHFSTSQADCCVPSRP